MPNQQSHTHLKKMNNAAKHIITFEKFTLKYLSEYQTERID